MNKRAQTQQQLFKGVLWKSCSGRYWKFQRKTSRLSLFLIVKTLDPAILLKEWYWQKSFPFNFVKYFRIVFVFCTFCKPNKTYSASNPKTIRKVYCQFLPHYSFITIRAFFVTFLTLLCWCPLNGHTYLKKICM